MEINQRPFESPRKPHFNKAEIFRQTAQRTIQRSADLPVSRMSPFVKTDRRIVPQFEETQRRLKMQRLSDELRLKGKSIDASARKQKISSACGRA